jgi:hypothetical protein
LPMVATTPRAGTSRPSHPAVTTGVTTRAGRLGQPGLVEKPAGSPPRLARRRPPASRRRCRCRSGRRAPLGLQRRCGRRPADNGGLGLGLPIVAAMAKAHHASHGADGLRPDGVGDEFGRRRLAAGQLRCGVDLMAQRSRERKLPGHLAVKTAEPARCRTPHSPPSLYTRCAFCLPIMPSTRCASARLHAPSATQRSTTARQASRNPRAPTRYSSGSP